MITSKDPKPAIPFIVTNPALGIVNSTVVRHMVGATSRVQTRPRRLRLLPGGVGRQPTVHHVGGDQHGDGPQARSQVLGTEQIHSTNRTRAVQRSWCSWPINLSSGTAGNWLLQSWAAAPATRIITAVDLTNVDLIGIGMA